LNATRKFGRKRISATRIAFLFPATYAVNQALKVSESKFLSWKLSRSARLASVLAADALASWSEASVPHFAAAKPDQAARTATTASRIASTMVISRSWPLASVAEPFACSSAFSASFLWCSAISLPTSLGDKPSGIAALLSDVTRPAVPVMTARSPARAIRRDPCDPSPPPAPVPGLTRRG
jgi:hypothetical protein